MDRIYMNRIDGQRRIHVEILDNEISDLLDDLTTGPGPFAATHVFLDVLRVAEETFSPVVAEGRRDRAARTATARQTGQQPDETVPTPEEGIEDARKVMQHVLQLFLYRVPREELDAETMADSLADALSDGLTELYRTAARATPTAGLDASQPTTDSSDRLRQLILNVMTGRAVCPAPRPVDEATSLIDAYLAAVLRELLTADTERTDK
ncbi:hypothetical protein [Streptomyces omiyaensis]|uniref:hypothetical protein n=1 Tax=Streptomyces omiyaensis TaxID=68247 RepID=UPI0036F90C82